MFALRVHRVGSTEWPAAVSDGLTLPCGQCGRVPRIDYQVTDDEWRRVIPAFHRLGVVCLDCFLNLDGDPLSVVEIQVVGTGVTVVTTPSIAYEYRSGADF